MSDTQSSCASNTCIESIYAAQCANQISQSLHNPASIKNISYLTSSKEYNSFILGKMKFSRLDSNSGLLVFFENIYEEQESIYEYKSSKDFSNFSDFSESVITKKNEPKKKKCIEKQPKQNSNKNFSSKKNKPSIEITCKIVNNLKFIQQIHFNSSFLEFYRQTSEEFQTQFHALSLEDQTYFSIFKTVFEKVSDPMKQKYNPYICAIENNLNRKIDTKVCIEVQRENDELGDTLKCSIQIIPMDFQSTTNPNLFNKRREGILNNKNKKNIRFLTEQEKQFLFLYKECNVNQNINTQSDILNYFQTCKYRMI